MHHYGAYLPLALPNLSDEKDSQPILLSYSGVNRSDSAYILACLLQALRYEK